MNDMNWNIFFEQQKKQVYFHQLLNYIKAQRELGKTIYPASENVFKAFEVTPFSKIKVVILGQDPYHGENQAHGLSFSVPIGEKIPPSLRNIYLELETNFNGFQAPSHGNLEKWAKQGVLLLNTVLTVEKSKPHSHAKIGWEDFTDKVLQLINQYQKDVVFLLWGGHAKRKGQLISRKKHHVLEAAHPSPLSAYRGFFGCEHFSKTNEILSQVNQEVIDWNLND